MTIPNDHQSLPTAPCTDPLSDIYPSSSPLAIPQPEALSDLPSRRRALQTDAYREALSATKPTTLQAGFDEGYALGAHVGLRTGYLLGILRGFVAAWEGQDEGVYREARALYEAARRELDLREVFGEKWVDGEGVWKWGVGVGRKLEGEDKEDEESEEEKEEEDMTLREVTEQHPVLRKWGKVVEELAERWGVDLRAVERARERNGEES